MLYRSTLEYVTKIIKGKGFSAAYVSGLNFLQLSAIMVIGNCDV